MGARPASGELFSVEFAASGELFRVEYSALGGLFSLEYSALGKLFSLEFPALGGQFSVEFPASGGLCSVGLMCSYHIASLRRYRNLGSECDWEGCARENSCCSRQENIHDLFCVSSQALHTGKRMWEF